MSSMKDIFSRRHDRNVRIGLFAAVFAVIGIATLALSDASSQRDVFNRPFAADSIWNTPIGSNARYVDAGYPYMRNNALDNAYFLELKGSDPLREVRGIGHWRARCAGGGDTGIRLNLPNGFRIPDASQNSNGSWRTPNNGWEFLLPDGRNVRFGSGAARCSDTGPLHTNTSRQQFDIYGDGLIGGHGASRLPHIGGAIRPGELSGNGSVQHPLSLILYTKYAYSDNKTTRQSTYRWPASSSDAYALDRGKNDRYIGNNPEMRMGSLLAIPPYVQPSDIGVSSSVGIKLFNAMRDWGGYFTEDSAWDANYLLVDAEANGTFSWGSREREEFGRIIDAAMVVANNGPNSIGGGGTPRVPKHPDFRDGNNSQPPAPTPTPPVDDSPNDPPQEEDEYDPDGGVYISPADNYLGNISATASSQTGNQFAADKVFDTDEQSNEGRWISEAQDDQWIQLDLQDRRTLDRLSILWAGDTTRQFDIRISEDGTNFTTVESGETDNQAFTLTEHDMNDSVARYVRVYGLSRWNNSFGHSIREVGIYVGEDPVDVVVPDDPVPDDDSSDDQDSSDQPTDQTVVSVPYRINSGGGAYTDGEGNTWVADTYFQVGGGDYAVTNPIAATDNDQLYQSERWCSPGYRVPVTNGRYTVVYHGAEINPRDDGRIMSVAVEGETFIDSFSLSREVGDYTAYQRSTTVDVRDGSLDVDVVGVNNCQKISGLEILPETVADTQAPSVEIVNLAEEQIVEGEITVSVTSADDREITRVSLLVNGLLKEESGAAITDFTLNTAEYVNGDLSIQAVAADASGNEGLDQVTVVVENPVIDIEAPSVPEGLSAENIDTNQVRLTWNASVDNVGVVKYTILRNGKSYAETSETTYTDQNAAPGQAFTYQVVAEDEAENVSERSTEATITTPQAADTQSPSTPTGFTAVAQADGSVVMSWDASSDNVAVDGYFVYRGNRIIASLEETTFTDTKAPQNRTHRYSVRAYDTSRNFSGRSDVVRVDVPAQDATTSPSAPRNLRHVRYLPWRSQFVFRWNQPAEIGSGGLTYNVIRNGKVIAKTSARSFADATIRVRVDYNYKISARDSADNLSAKSNNLFFKARR